ncbi:Uncharacterised protein [Mycobacteroides abscessus subsp. abscessus]|nr:Uncharacterised protein [Mycobacteroides abscessus subsp. abscessus]
MAVFSARSKPRRLSRPVSTSMSASEAMRVRMPTTTPTPNVTPAGMIPDHHGRSLVGSDHRHSTTAKAMCAAACGQRKNSAASQAMKT